MLKYLKAGVALVSLLAVSAMPSVAETLRIGDSFPVGHYIAENMTKFWMEDVKSRSGGKIDFQYFPAEQMGKAKDLLSLTQSGVLDIGYVGPSYVSDKLPLSSVGEMPEAFTNSCQGTKAFWEIAKPGGALDQAEFAPNGVRVLLVMVLPPYQVFTAKREISGLDSFKGLKLRTTGGAKEIATHSIGAVPVQMAAPEARDALSRGTLDGLLFPHSSILPYDVLPFLKYATQDVNFGSFVVTYVISQQKWDQLDAETQKILAEAGEAATMHGCEVADKLDGVDKQTIADGGVTFVSLPDADKAKLEELLGTLSNRWADELDQRGKPGKTILGAFRDALGAAQ
ncbi:TRAP transporter substrate-binding protein DctP [Aquamicrobium sp. LC103]|uniref:TRAP transporter substrate-binding protein n=1 Tax=Aquamicrobium sp. LC103 TaxID=1120658 RepID=UPI00063EB9CE|nr:TRAP transporter substrate-binding protein DctP [Aquamicrobium sp. LC103]TKT74804.1 C4-dicarboxylate ABC transporter [Aquamicrobium sp. LC103]